MQGQFYVLAKFHKREVCFLFFVFFFCSVMNDSFDPIDCNLLGYSVHGILQARILEWVAIFFSGVFPTQRLNLGLLHCRWIFLPYFDMNTIGNTSFKNKWKFYKLNKQYETHISLLLFFSFSSDWWGVGRRLALIPRLAFQYNWIKIKRQHWNE